ncbi:MAG TPA: GAF domain-containing protein [Ktedonobacteraceae bacterium]|jgi:hypothetical protein
MSSESGWGSWRELLSALTSAPEERRRIARSLNVGEVTLRRWVQGKTTPRHWQLRPLLALFPQYREQFVALILQELPDFSAVELESTQPSTQLLAQAYIPVDVYENVLSMRESAPPKHLFWSISSIVLRAALEQLDETHMGLGIWIYQCQESQSGEVIGLRARAQMGSPPWGRNLDPLHLVGSESLSGYAVATQRLSVCQNVRNAVVPVRPEEYVESCAACPLQLREQLAGCIVFASTTPNFFSPQKVALIEHYARLCTLAFLDSEYWPYGKVQLREMPSDTVQKALFASLGQRRAAALKRTTSIEEAEHLLWSRVVEECALPLHSLQG